MTITYFGANIFNIKCKEGSITTGDSIKINDFEITGPGEYEIAGISAETMDGITIFYAEDINIAFINRKKILDDKELEKVEGTDILFVPFGENDSKMSLEITNQIEPKVLIPTFGQDASEIKKIEGISPEIMDQLKITKSTLPEERKVIALNVQK